jgi:hypothetical protein
MIFAAKQEITIIVQMKKITILFLVSVLVFGCRSWSPMSIEQEKAPINPQIPSLQLYAGTEYYTEILSETEFRLFRQEMEENVMNPYGDKYGSAFYSSRIVDEKSGMGFIILSGISLYTLNLVGLPMHRINRTIEIEIRILDLKGRLIGKYIGRGTGKANIGLYYGFDWTSAYDKVLYESITEALSSIRTSIDKDSERIKTELLKTEAEIKSGE